MPTSPILQPVRVVGTAVGGCSVFHRISTGDTNAVSIKASGGTVFGWAIGSASGNIRYVKLYNKATAPTVGTDTPAMTIEVPGNTSGAGTNFCFVPGVAFPTGIGLAATGGIGDADSSSVGANDLTIQVFYT